MQFFDAHTHLNHETLFADWEKHLQNFAQTGGKGLVNIGANTNYNQHGIFIAQNYKKSVPDLWCKATVGIHPCDVGDHLGTVEEEIGQLRNRAKTHPKEIVAIGECGIDLYYPGTPETFELQEAFFLAQCQLARELNLPIIIHSRSAFEETLHILKDFRDLKIYFHCRSYTEQEIQTLIEIFPQIWIGYTGILTYKKSDAIKASLLATPKDKILIETDAPYLAPQVVRGQINTPERVKEIGLFASKLLAISEEMFWEQVECNFWRLYDETRGKQ